MLRKLLVMMCALGLALPLANALLSQTAPAQAKQARVEGNVVRHSTEKSTLTVRETNTTVEKTVMFDSATKWVSQEHGSKKVNDIDPGQVKDGDRVICTGTLEKGILHATLISKRLSHPSE
jgi:hypothetical protein